MITIISQPLYVCLQCGLKYGRGPHNTMATWHMDTCGVCRHTKYVTQPRDFGHLDASWEHEGREEVVGDL